MFNNLGSVVKEDVIYSSPGLFKLLNKEKDYNLTLSLIVNNNV